MSKIAHFLEARIAEDEAAALTATHADHSDPPSRQPHATSTYAPIWQPDRVLCECAAKRELLRYVHSWIDFPIEGSYPEAMARAICTDVMRRLALAYADHPDYDPTWWLDD